MKDWSQVRGRQVRPGRRSIWPFAQATAFPVEGRIPQTPGRLKGRQLCGTRDRLNLAGSSDDPIDRRWEPSVPVARRRDRRRGDGRRHRAASQSPGGRPARVHAAICRDPDRIAWALGGGGGAVHHRAPGGGPLERCRGSRRDPLRVGPGPVVDRARVRARVRPLHRAGLGAGAPHAGGCSRVPERLEAPPDAAAALVVQSRIDDRAFLREAVGNRSVGPGALDGEAAPDGRPRRGQRGHLGNARAAVPGPGRPQGAAREERHPGPGRRDRG